MKFKLNDIKKSHILPEWQKIAKDRIGQGFDNQMNAVVYQWPRDTVTKSGNPFVKGSPRKITDTGELEGSRVSSVSADGKTIKHLWDVDHAATVLLGGTNANGTYQPSRDWITPVLIDELM